MTDNDLDPAQEALGGMLMVDPLRIYRPVTDIYVRARNGEAWDSFDISALDRASLLRWLHSRGDCNPWAENVVGLLLGHVHLHDYPEEPEPGAYPASITT